MNKRISSLLRIAGTAALAFPVIAGVVSSGTGVADAAAPPPYQSTELFTFRGFTDQTFTVPPLVTQLAIDARAGQGGNGGGSSGVSGGPGGKGAEVIDLIGVTPGQVFTVRPGIKGIDGEGWGGAAGRGGWNPDGANYGGYGGYPDGSIAGAGGGGGALTMVLDGNSVVVAAGGGGGGGGGGGTVGYSGGAGGQAGASSLSGADGSGSGAGSGSGGHRACFPTAHNGTAGGSAGTGTSAGAGGGGGAGYADTACGGTGGGAGGAGAGGGGGGAAGYSYVDPDTSYGSNFLTDALGGDGSVRFSWAQPQSKTRLSVFGGGTVGDVALVSASVAPASGALFPQPTGEVDFYSGSTLLGTTTLSNGEVSLQTGALPGGTSSVRAVYLGDDVFASSVGIVSVTMSRAQPVFTAGVTPPDSAGQRYMVATVRRPPGASTSAPLPTGTVKFDQIYPGGLIPSGSADLDAASGTASLFNTWNDGTYDYQVTYSGDANYLGAVTTFTLHIGPQAPVAAAGQSRPAASGSRIILDGSGSSDPLGQPLQYDWLQIDGPTAVITDRRAAATSVTLPAGPSTVHFRLTVTNADGLSDTDEITISILGPAPK